MRLDLAGTEFVNVLSRVKRTLVLIRRTSLIGPSETSAASEEPSKKINVLEKTGGLIMDENRVEGSLRNVGGKVQEGVGRTTGDTKSTAEGVMNQAAGTAQDLYGQSADVARETASNLDTWLRNTIENQPYTSAIVALGVGWLLGRMHRPL